ncbi:molybdopterin molybdotransferase MoeA [Fulvivirga sediminis]|uniref:Molybdopterin molybdenumtransferase n=1 Tax=Fulvivirga sediminis TaxID=2803949 RepID=A0A937F746_9BACT|nr:gephyrin-like molybdotransferase Glp [Fulvivirga sediminis]MBL3657662.1 molybdopterin molybdotransferase MoeA [Fulvivirga sediminis]
MISIKEALKLVQSQNIKTTPVEKELSSALGYHLAETITAPFSMPDFNNSAMDGYAVCGIYENYHIVGEVAAGSTVDHALEDGQAIRIFTGGKVPENTTAVVMQEKTSAEDKQLTIIGEIKAGQNIRAIGDELKKGQEVFTTGHYINAASLGMLASLGKTMVKVYEKPTIKLITTGNELIMPGQERKKGQIYESNSHALCGALLEQGFNCCEKQQIEDNFELIKSGISSYLEQTDVLLLSGGISVGDYDYVKEALEENGVKEIYYKVFQKPGKPLYFGRKGDKFVFALPGNPASSLSCFYIHVLPLLQRLSGGKSDGLPKVNLPLTHHYELKGDRPAFLKASVKNSEVTILDGQMSSMIRSMAIGNALVYIPEPKKIERGEKVQCLLIS